MLEKILRGFGPAALKAWNEENDKGRSASLRRGGRGLALVRGLAGSSRERVGFPQEVERFRGAAAIQNRGFDWS